MRRIDLFCKLFGPLVIALIDSASPRIAIIVTGAMTGLSVLVEYFTIARVYKRIPALQEPKPSATERWANRGSLGSRVKNLLSGTAIYARHPAFLPSFSLALLYLTVLSFSGQMITYLISLGMSPSLVGGLRAISALFELSATWLAPIIMSKIGPVRSGAWFLNWEIICVTIACAFFWLDFSQTLAGVGTVSAVIASRVGLWGFDLSAQIIVQEVSHPPSTSSSADQSAGGRGALSWQLLQPGICSPERLRNDCLREHHRLPRPITVQISSHHKCRYGCEERFHDSYHVN